MRKLLKVFSLLLPLFVSYSCSEEIDTSARYVFKYETILSYLQKHEAYHEYADLLNKVSMGRKNSSTVAQLLGARGNYTVFAPTNEAIHNYLQSLVDEQLISEPSWDAFTDSVKLDSVRRVVVFSSIIDGGDELDNFYYVNNFPEADKGEFVLGNLFDRKLSISRFTQDPDSLCINGDCPIDKIQRDILTINGIIHQIGKVIASKDITAASYIQECLDEQRDGYLTMFRAIQACGLLDTLSAVRDEVYEELYQQGKIDDLHGMMQVGFAEGETASAPKHRLYGFTIFAETDDFWRSVGIDPTSPDLLKNLMKWILDNHQYSDEDVFTTDANYTSEKNLLYQWVTYHILPMKIPADKLVFHINELGFNLNNPKSYGIPVYEYYTSFGKRRLFKLYESKESNGIYINRFPVHDNGRKGTNHEISCDPDKVGCKIEAESPLALLTDMVNCNIYPIDAPLSYNDNVRDNLKKERIRFDGMSLFPEAINNDIRLKKATAEQYKHVYIPNTVRAYNYFPNMQQNADMEFVYYNAWNDDWCNLQRDEMKAVGRYEVMFTLPPVPRRGTYEVRYKVLANGNRGIAQIYFGSDPDNLPVAGIPIDLTMGFNSDRGIRQTGWEDDQKDDDDYNSEIDKRLRNNGYMKGPQSINSDNGTERGINDRENIRHIFIRQTLDPDKTYYIKLKSVLESNKKEFYMDFIEYCAKEIYDNPVTPEDIW